MASRHDPGATRRWHSALSVSGALLVPLAIFVAGIRIAGDLNIAATQIAAEIGEKELQAEYVGIAVEILSRCPPSNSGEELDTGRVSPADRALREWAVAVLQENSPVGLDAKLVEDLSSCAVRLEVPSSLFGALVQQDYVFPSRDVGLIVLPEGCIVELHSGPVLDELELDIPLYAEPFLFGFLYTEPAPIAFVSPGAYEASEFQADPFGASGWYKIVDPEGWVRASNAIPSSTECFG